MNLNLKNIFSFSPFYPCNPNLNYRKIKLLFLGDIVCSKGDFIVLPNYRAKCGYYYYPQVGQPFEQFT